MEDGRSRSQLEQLKPEKDLLNLNSQTTRNAYLNKSLQTNTRKVGLNQPLLGKINVSPLFDNDEDSATQDSLMPDI